MSAVGAKHETIAAIIGIDDKTLRKHYREELDNGSDIANAQIGGSLFTKAIGGDTSALIFWCKTRMGWTEGTKLTIEDLRETVNGASTEALKELAGGDDPAAGA